MRVMPEMGGRSCIIPKPDLVFMDITMSVMDGLKSPERF